jgi:hypothetical protein
MDKHQDQLGSIDPKKPHLFMERMNLPYDIPKGASAQAWAQGPRPHSRERACRTRARCVV